MVKIHSAVAILDRLSKYAVETGISQKTKIGMIPEINMQAEHVTTNLFNELSDYYEAQGKTLNLEAFMSWCAFAGIGGSYLWHYKWSEIKDTGVWRHLSDNTNINELDEYVLKMVGNPIDTNEGKRIWSICRALGNESFDFFSEEINDSETAMKQIKEMAKALFNYGVAYGLEMLGM